MKIKLTILLLLLAMFTGCSSKSDDFVNPYLSIAGSKDTTIQDESSYFDNLTIANVSLNTSYKGFNKISGKITNNNSVKINGYIKVALYDSDRNLVDSVSLSLPVGGIAAGKTGLVSTIINKGNYDSYEFFDSALGSF